ncbi:hypothetical protein [Flectobacillus longus]|uniref:hypothetical protein n=1 Tax=Flectobacillus longus TaxID=2984207 RepID=UPI0024B756F6|nr:hypothetical protein [Flectobacillus longus]MDI9882802.1 hypothetical protein [Flectobacillus longus]
MRHILSSILLGVSLLVSGHVVGQIKYQLKLDDNLKTYHVYVLSEKSYPSPNNLISTAQITFKVKSGSDFKLNNLRSSSDSDIWDLNGVLKSPSLAPTYTYYSVGLQTMGTSHYALQEGELVELFSFENTGTENPQIQLISESDVMVQNQKTTKINIGNQINLLGVSSGLQNAYSGNTGESGVSVLSLQSIYPNPAIDKLKVQWDNRLAEEPSELKLQLIDATTGITVQEEILDPSYGKHEAGVDLLKVKLGGYLIKLQSKNFSSKAVHVVVTK